MGIVYRAGDTGLDRPVALKVIGHVSDPDRRQRFVKEARAAAAFNHPNIVTIYEIDAHDGIDFIVMALLSGESLSRRIRPGGLPLADADDQRPQRLPLLDGDGPATALPPAGRGARGQGATHRYRAGTSPTTCTTRCARRSTGSTATSDR